MSDDCFDRFDEMAERTIYPWIDDEGNYFHDEDMELDDNEDEYDDFDDYYDDSMDGDHDSAMKDAGWGTDEDYGYYGEDY